VLLTGICPLIAWRRAGLKNLQRNFLGPTIFGLIGVILLLLFGIRHFMALLFVFSSLFVLATVYLEFSRATQARMHMVKEPATAALVGLVARNKRRYGGFIIHTGFALLFIGIAASSYFQFEQDTMVQPQKSFMAKDFQIHFRQLASFSDSHKEVIRAELEIFKNGESLGFLFPERHFYKNSDQPTTEVALRSSMKEDLYVILAAWDEKGAATFKVYINPLIGLIWYGGLIMALGGLIVLMPDYKPQLAVQTVPQPHAPQEAT
ncbi:MAG TPA: cytochrome c-type biogenesis CcmF C-terminal domain-containing protein, partial [Acidobacteriota bacterium]|nr:cytochrome c-type biogenesis CcmF C-terminal domain-containing protein [Acidobacteriota bacterium]